MLMIQQGQADGDGTHGKHDDAQCPILPPVQLLVHPWDAFGGTNVDVDTGRDGQDEADGLSGQILHGQDGDAPQHDRQARQKVECQRPGYGKTGVLGQNEEIGQLLGNLVVQGDEQDGQGHVTGAQEKANAHKDSVGKVVEGISEEDGGAERIVDGAAVVASLRGGDTGRMSALGVSVGMGMAMGAGSSSLTGFQDVSLIFEDALSMVTVVATVVVVVMIVVEGEAVVGVLAVLALLAAIGRFARSDGLGSVQGSSFGVLWYILVLTGGGLHLAVAAVIVGLAVDGILVNAMGSVEEGKLAGGILIAQAGSLAALVVAFVLLSTGEHGSKDHGDEISSEDGAAKLPLDTLDLTFVAGVVCGK